MSRSFYCAGNIYPSAFVKCDTGVDGQVLLGTAGTGNAGDPCVGISQEGTHLPPWSLLDDGYAGTAEAYPQQADQILVYTEGDECLLTAGASFSSGQCLKSAASGYGIYANTAGDNISAIALETPTAASQLVKVKVAAYRVVQGAGSP
jgi:hypothetical protein